MNNMPPQAHQFEYVYRALMSEREELIDRIGALRVSIAEERRKRVLDDAVHAENLRLRRELHALKARLQHNGIGGSA